MALPAAHRSLLTDVAADIDARNAEIDGKAAQLGSLRSDPERDGRGGTEAGDGAAPLLSWVHKAQLAAHRTYKADAVYQKALRVYHEQALRHALRPETSRVCKLLRSVGIESFPCFQSSDMLRSDFPTCYSSCEYVRVCEQEPAPAEAGEATAPDEAPATAAAPADAPAPSEAATEASTPSTAESLTKLMQRALSKTREVKYVPYVTARTASALFVSMHDQNSTLITPCAASNQLAIRMRLVLYNAHTGERYTQDDPRDLVQPDGKLFDVHGVRDALTHDWIAVDPARGEFDLYTSHTYEVRLTMHFQCRNRGLYQSRYVIAVEPCALRMRTALECIDEPVEPSDPWVMCMRALTCPFTVYARFRCKADGVAWADGPKHVASRKRARHTVALDDDEQDVEATEMPTRTWMPIRGPSTEATLHGVRQMTIHAIGQANAWAMLGAIEAVLSSPHAESDDEGSSEYAARALGELNSIEKSIGLAVDDESLYDGLCSTKNGHVLGTSIVGYMRTARTCLYIKSDADTSPPAEVAATIAATGERFVAPWVVQALEQAKRTVCSYHASSPQVAQAQDRSPGWLRGIFWSFCSAWAQPERPLQVQLGMWLELERKYRTGTRHHALVMNPRHGAGSHQSMRLTSGMPLFAVQDIGFTIDVSSPHRGGSTCIISAMRLAMHVPTTVYTVTARPTVVQDDAAVDASVTADASIGGAYATRSARMNESIAWQSPLLVVVGKDRRRPVDWQGMDIDVDRVYTPLPPGVTVPPSRAKPRPVRYKLPGEDEQAAWLADAPPSRNPHQRCLITAVERDFTAYKLSIDDEGTFWGIEPRVVEAQPVADAAAAAPSTAANGAGAPASEPSGPSNDGSVEGDDASSEHGSD